MDAQPPQNFENHRSYDPLFMVSGVILILNALFALVGVVRAPGFASIQGLLLSAALVGIGFRTRTYPIRVQDRIIRLEMRLRLERILPADLKDRIGDLTLPQLIGLRFASDGEMPDLVRKVLAEKTEKADDAKKMVKDWQADRLRV